MKIFLYLICLLTFNAWADSKYTDVKPGVKIYSEYYPNRSAKFTGTMIFLNGSGTSITEWKDAPKLLECAKKLGSIFLYDRSGLGKSPPDFSVSANQSLTAEKINRELEILLKERNIKPPYILVAHSYGAIYAGYFLLKHPTLIEGILLVDPVPRQFNFSSKLLAKYQKGIEEAKIKSARDIYQKYGGSKTEVIYQILGLKSSQESLQALGAIDNNIPVVILSSTGAEKKHSLVEDWFESQKQWLNKNPHSKISQVNSGHFIQIAHPQKVCAELQTILSFYNL